ncbi:MAG: Uma2 family endonuclease [Pseudanabaenaceae cyanobacterium]
MVALKLAQTYSPEAYLAWEAQAETRHEYRNGEITAMPGGTPNHNEIARMLVFLLTAGLRHQPYSIFIADQRLWIPAANRYTYPDVMVTPRPAELQPGRRDTVMNPIWIAEVLSESTEAYDGTDKFRAYRTIPTLREYLLIAQDTLRVEHYCQQNASTWLFREYSDRRDVLTLPALEMSLSLAELYEAVEI